MKKKLSAMRIMFLCVFAASIFASCSRQTAYNSMHSNQLQAQQIPGTGNNQPAVAMENNTMAVQETVYSGEVNKAPIAQTKPIFHKQKNLKI